MDAGGGIVRDLVSPMWRTTWDAHGMVGNLTDVYTGRVCGCSPLTFGAQILGVVSRFKRLDQDVEQGPAAHRDRGGAEWATLRR